MEFRMLGALEAQRDGLPISLAGPKQRSVLAMLLLDANRVVSTERLVDALQHLPAVYRVPPPSMSTSRTCARSSRPTGAPGPSRRC